MNSNSKQNEGELLRAILLQRYGTLKKAAENLALNYGHLSEQCGLPQLTERYKTRVAKMLNIPVDYFETGEMPPDTTPRDEYIKALEIRAEKAEQEARDIWQKYVRLLEKFAGTDQP